MNSDFVKTMTATERRAELERAVIGYIRSGAVVLHQADTEVLMMYPGKRVNNVLHAVLTLFTFGMWIPIWAMVAIHCAVNSDKTFTVSVDEYGGTSDDLNSPARSKNSRFTSSAPDPVNPRSTGSALTWVAVVFGVFVLILILAI